jgi:capsular exopolysaccharide synthesis family protein
MRNPFSRGHPMSLARQIEQPTIAYVDIVDNLLITTDNKPKQQWLVTSARTGDGVTTTAFGLAQTLGARGKSTVLIDANFVDASLSKVCCNAPDTGFVQILKGDCEITSAILPSNNTRTFSIIPAGTGTLEPLQLLNSKRIKARIEALSTSFDYVLIDTPAFDSNFAVRLLLSCVHGCILVVRAEKTTKQRLVKLTQQIEKSGGHLLGFIFNCEQPWAQKIANYWM